MRAQTLGSDGARTAAWMGAPCTTVTLVMAPSYPSAAVTHGGDPAWPRTIAVGMSVRIGGSGTVARPLFGSAKDATGSPARNSVAVSL